MPEQDPPAPWRRVPVSVGGVVAVGFGTHTELLLVLTHSGLGIIDVPSGEVVARKVDIDDDDYDDRPVQARGIGPLAGQPVALSGLWGGGLRTMTPDGWMIHRAAPNWPAECAVLCPPGNPGNLDQSSAILLVKDLDPPIRALGFSDSGRSMVVANTLLYIWRRETSF